MSDTLFEQYTNDNDFATYASGNHRGQTFTATSNHSITSLKLKLFKDGDPGTVTVKIYATSSDLPTGAVLTSGTTNGNTLTTGDTGEIREFTVTPYDLSNGTKYAIVVEWAANNLGFRYNNTGSGYTGGSWIYYDGSWHEDTTRDLYFQIYGISSDISISPSPTEISVSLPIPSITLEAGEISITVPATSINLTLPLPVIDLISIWSNPIKSATVTFTNPAKNNSTWKNQDKS